MVWVPCVRGTISNLTQNGRVVVINGDSALVEIRYGRQRDKLAFNVADLKVTRTAKPCEEYQRRPRARSDVRCVCGWEREQHASPGAAAGGEEP
jgi:hypothetical protein